MALLYSRAHPEENLDSQIYGLLCVRCNSKGAEWQGQARCVKSARSVEGWVHRG